MKERVLFIAVGQGGGNIGKLFEEKGYHCLFINTSFDDLKTIDVKHKLHIAGAFGCNKDRKKAVQYVKESYKTIDRVVESKFPQQDLVYFIFTAGGGTGSGLSPVLIDLLSQRNRDKHYGAITVLPSLQESLKSQINSVEAYKDLARIDNLKNLIVLDNNILDDRFEINKKFVEAFDSFMNISIPDERGIIDPSEVETLMTCKGGLNIFVSSTKRRDGLSQYKGFSKPMSITDDIINNIDKSPFTPFETGSCRYLAVSQCGEADIKEIGLLVGTPIDTFYGYNEENIIVVMAGLSYPKQRVKELIENIDIEQSKIEDEQEKTMEDDFLKKIEVPTLRVDKEYTPNIFTKPPTEDKMVIKEMQKEEKHDKIDIEDIFSKFS